MKKFKYILLFLIAVILQVALIYGLRCLALPLHLCITEFLTNTDELHIWFVSLISVLMLIMVAFSGMFAVTVLLLIEGVMIALMFKIHSFREFLLTYPVVAKVMKVLKC